MDWNSIQCHINALLDGGNPFAVFMLPGDSSVMLADGKRQDFTFGIVPWLGSHADAVCIPTLMPKAGVMPVERHSTTREDYLYGVGKVIESCQCRNGKTVYSRIICADIKNGERIDWGMTAIKLFMSHNHCFRFLYFTPQTGAWLGATPELLLDFCHSTGRLSTVALAGTRRRGIPGEWDEKNLRENRFVSDYIVGQLDNLGIKAEVAPLGEVGYGNISHLCAEISASSTSDMIPTILDAISPTPALCGFPKADAINDICNYEKHDRGCYGGYLAITTRERFMAYVNLRCVHFDKHGYCVFGGGGITEQSDAETEYAETDDKTRPLIKLIESCRMQDDKWQNRFN